MIAAKIVEFLKALSGMSRVKVAFYDNGQERVTSQVRPEASAFFLARTSGRFQ
jgi:hypothetical protein